MKFLVSTHQGKLYDEELDYIIVHTKNNEFAIMKNHMPLICVIDDGYIKMVGNETETYLALSNGVIEFKNNIVNIIAQEAYIGFTKEKAISNLERLRKQALEHNRKETTDFTKQENELRENLKKAKAGNL